MPKDSASLIGDVAYCIKKLEELRIIEHIQKPTLDWVCERVVGKRFVYRPGSVHRAPHATLLMSSGIISAMTFGSEEEPPVRLYVSGGPLFRFELSATEGLWDAYRTVGTLHSVGTLTIVDR